MRERKSLKKEGKEEKTHRAKWNSRSYIGWAENRHSGCIVHPPIRAANTEITEKYKKIRAENVSRETFFHTKKTIQQA